MIQMIQLYLIQDRGFSFLVSFFTIFPLYLGKKLKSHPKHPTCLVLGQHASLEELRFLSTKKTIRFEGKGTSFWETRLARIGQKMIYPVLNRYFCWNVCIFHKFPNCFLGMLSVELSEIQISNLGVFNLKCINTHISSTFNISCPKGILTIASLRYLLDIGSQQNSQKHS